MSERQARRVRSRLCGVSAFAFQGTNAHALLQPAVHRSVASPPLHGMRTASLHAHWPTPLPHPLLGAFTPLTYLRKRLRFCVSRYIAHFTGAMEAAAPAPQPAERLGNMRETFLRILYNNVCRSLFEKVGAHLRSPRKVSGGGRAPRRRS